MSDDNAKTYLWIRSNTKETWERTIYVLHWFSLGLKVREQPRDFNILSLSPETFAFSELFCALLAWKIVSVTHKRAKPNSLSTTPYVDVRVDALPSIIRAYQRKLNIVDNSGGIRRSLESFNFREKGHREFSMFYRIFKNLKFSPADFPRKRCRNVSVFRFSLAWPEGPLLERYDF